ncbi:MAG: cysteine desulfurase [Gammaproteobacteria bacterium]|nr:cysteine desulfurase [Gammaproteobacteria bacterium]
MNTSLDLQAIRNNFPILKQTMSGEPLIYLDSGATSQKPQCVIDVMTTYCEKFNANVHRGIYSLSEDATLTYEAARQATKDFIHAEHTDEIIFTKGTTEAINLVAYGFAEQFLKTGDEIIVSVMEHHSNIVPWQIACERKGAKLKVIPLLEDGSLDLIEYEKLLSSKTKLVAITHVSNVLGTINPIKAIIAKAHAANAPVLIDGAQGVPHLKIDVQDLDCDFYAFSAHKMYGPMGVGVLYGKQKWLEALPPYQGGGEMIRQVSFEKTEYAALPHKFEAGTPNVGGVFGFKAALDYMHQLGLENIGLHEHKLLQYATEKLQQIPGLKIIGSAKNKAAVISFTMSQAHPHDIGTILDSEGVAIRAGHHCAMPLMQYLKLSATARASFGIYNNQADVDKLVQALMKVIKLFGD